MLVSPWLVQVLPLATLGALVLIVVLAVIGIWPPLRAPRGTVAGHARRRALHAVPRPTTPWRCALCESATPLDDVAEGVSGDICVCLRCLGMLTGTVRPMPAVLEHAIRVVVAES